MASERISHCINLTTVNSMLLIIGSLLVAQGYLVSGGKLVDKIRRQLMEDNYDYLPSEEELMSATQHFDRDVPNDPLYIDNDTLADSIDRQDKAELFVPRVEDSLEDSKRNDHEISKKDLLYYMDDERLKGTAHNDMDGANYNSDDANGTSPKVKYKVLKMKSLDPSRRSLSYRRFIQEEKEDGVAIISLDGQPFPEFHLPRSRRQYMHDRDSGELSEDAIDNAMKGV